MVVSVQDGDGGLDRTYEAGLGAVLEAEEKNFLLGYSCIWECVQLEYDASLRIA